MHLFADELTVKVCAGDYNELLKNSAEIMKLFESALTKLKLELDPRNSHIIIAGESHCLDS